MKHRDIGLRAQDIQTGLQEVELSGPAAGMLDTTLLTGMAERLAIHVRGIEIIDDEHRLHVLGDRLGISTLVMPTVLNLLEEAEFVAVERRSGRISRVVDRVPYFGNIYERLGEIWVARSPSDVEHATVQVLDRLAKAPDSRESVADDVGLDDTDFKVMLKVGQEGGYLGEFMSPNSAEPVLYSPLYWEELGEETFNLLQKHGAERILKALERVASYQGLPLPDAAAEGSSDDQIVFEAMAAGLLPSPEVDSVNGRRQFAFTPYRGQVLLNVDERAILQKARAILACVRYGQHYGGVTRIRRPLALLNALSTRGQLSPHSEIPQQYATLVVEGIARVSPAKGLSGRYVLEVIDTPENKRALRIATDMLTVGQVVAERGVDAAARQALFTGGSIKDPLTARADVVRRRRQPEMPAEAIKRQIERIVDDLRQV